LPPLHNALCRKSQLLKTIRCFLIVLSGYGVLDDRSGVERVLSRQAECIFVTRTLHQRIGTASMMQRVHAHALSDDHIQAFLVLLHGPVQASPAKARMQIAYSQLPVPPQASVANLGEVFYCAVA
jgi:hypothetical protein